VEENLVRRGFLRDHGEPPVHRFLFTGDVDRARELGRLFLGPEVVEVEKVELPLRGVGR